MSKGLNLNLKEKSFSAIISLAGASVSIIALIGFCIYGAIYHEYFDFVVMGCLLLGAVGAGTYALIDHPVTEILNVFAVFFVSFGMGLFGLNSYNVWADWWGNFTMYGSRGGLVPVIILFICYFLAIICNIVSCFTRKEAKVQ